MREKFSLFILENLTVKEALSIIIILFWEWDVHWNKDGGKLEPWVKNRIPDSRLFLLFTNFIKHRQQNACSDSH